MKTYQELSESAKDKFLKEELDFMMEIPFLQNTEKDREKAIRYLMECKFSDDETKNFGPPWLQAPDPDEFRMDYSGRF